MLSTVDHALLPQEGGLHIELFDITLVTVIYTGGKLGLSCWGENKDELVAERKQLQDEGNCMLINFTTFTL
jgi:hypothetical protein